MARETPKRLEDTQASRLTSVQLLFSGFTRYSQRSSTTCTRHSPAVGTARAPPPPAPPGSSAYHETSVVDVPGERGHGPVLGVHDRVLQDVDGVGDIGWEEALCPARHPVGLGQEPPREQLVVRRHLPVHDVLGQDMFAETGNKTSRPARRQLCPGLGTIRQQGIKGGRTGLPAGHRRGRTPIPDGRSPREPRGKGRAGHGGRHRPREGAGAGAGPGAPVGVGVALPEGGEHLVPGPLEDAQAGAVFPHGAAAQARASWAAAMRLPRPAPPRRALPPRSAHFRARPARFRPRPARFRPRPAGAAPPGGGGGARMSGRRVDAKVVLLGQEGVGKSSLVERCAHGRFRAGPYQNVSDTGRARHGAPRVPPVLPPFPTHVSGTASPRVVPSPPCPGPAASPQRSRIAPFVSSPSFPALR